VIKFLIDEDMPRSTGEILKIAGHHAVDVRDCGLRGRSDEEVFEFAQQAGAIILTADVGFGNLHKYPLATHHGIFIVHFPNEVSTQELNKQLVEALTLLTETDYKGNLIILEPARIRIRRHKRDRK
jgi:predicted nuclease of predicted toxin-antitoxin system